MDTYIHMCIHYTGVGSEEKTGGTKLYGKMNGGYKRVHEIVLQMFP